MYSFSQTLDSLVEELLRPDLKPAMVNYLNLTIRELHSTRANPDTPPVPVGYMSNLVEAELTADEDLGFTWDIPTPRKFQMMESVYYTQFGRYATQRRPSSIMQFEESVDGGQYQWYRSGDTMVFSNYGGDQAQILLAYFQYLPSLVDYPVASRPAYFSVTDDEWKYHADYDVSDATRLAAYELCSNWMLERHRDTLMQGVRAKVWARLADESRMRTAYSSYQSLRAELVASETYDAAPRYRR